MKEDAEHCGDGCLASACGQLADRGAALTDGVVDDLLDEGDLVFALLERT